jgi:hypothetical protein
MSLPQEEGSSHNNFTDGVADLHCQFWKDLNLLIFWICYLFNHWFRTVYFLNQSVRPTGVVVNILYRIMRLQYVQCVHPYMLFGGSSALLILMDEWRFCQKAKKVLYRIMRLQYVQCVHPNMLYGGSLQPQLHLYLWMNGKFVKRQRKLVWWLISS